MIKSAQNIPIDKLLGKNDNVQEVFYKIPPYQREYSWKKEQWENLFDDIADNTHGYFLGSIICIDHGEYLDVIDGQQRLTTLSILLNAILGILKEKVDNNEISFRDKKYRRAFDNLEDKIYVEDEQKSRLILSIQNNNNDDYEYLLFINDFLNIKERTLHFGKRRVSKAYEYFKSRIEELKEDGTFVFEIDDIFEFYQKVMSALLVKIEVNDIASAFTLFESINNRGVPLTPIDLIKNSIIGEMDRIGKDSHTTNNEWQNIVNNIESYEAQVRFLRHYYNAFSNNPNVKIPTYSKATKSNIIHIYSNHIKKDVEFIFYDLIKKSNIYSIFVHPENISDEEYLPYKQKLIDLDRLKVAPAYSLLLHLFEQGVNEDTIKILNLIEDWFIRRHLTDFPGTSKLDQLFLDLVNKLSLEEKNDFETIRAYMMDTKRYRSDDEFRNFLKVQDIYTLNSNATRCLLTKLESSKRSKETTVDFWQETSKGKLIWSIEHILPQKPDDKSDWKDIFNKEELNLYLHKIGNLTLTCYNSSLSNKSFNKKVSIVDNDGKDVGLKSKNICINDYLLEVQKWDKSVIEKRGDILIEDIISLVNSY